MACGKWVRDCERYRSWGKGMTQWQIWCGAQKAHRVEADSEEEAIARWLDDQAMDCIEQAAREYGCQVGQIRADPTGRKLTKSLSF